jgi:putative transposase
MARKKAQPQATIWRVSDELWSYMEALIELEDPAPRTGRRRINAREALDAIIYRMRTGCQWNQLPTEFPDDSSVHRTMQRWMKLGLFEKLWAILVERCDELDGVDWSWQSADGSMGKARFGGISWARTLRTAAKTAVSEASWSKRPAARSAW